MSSISVISNNNYLIYTIDSIVEEIAYEKEVNIYDANVLISYLQKDKNFTIKNLSILADTWFRPYHIFFYDKYNFTGIIYADYSITELKKALIKVGEGGNFIKSDILKKIYSKKITQVYANLNTLTPTEKSIVSFISENKTNTEIAAIQKSSIRTIENHKYKIFKKTDVRNAAELVLLLTNYAPWMLASSV